MRLLRAIKLRPRQAAICAIIIVAYSVIAGVMVALALTTAVRLDDIRDAVRRIPSQIVFQPKS